MRLKGTDLWHYVHIMLISSACMCQQSTGPIATRDSPFLPQFRWPKPSPVLISPTEEWLGWVGLSGLVHPPKVVTNSST